MDTNLDATSTPARRESYRHHRLEFKRAVVEETLRPGVSVALVARTHGINANQLHKWRQQFSVARTTVAVSVPSLIPVTVIPDEPARSSVEDSPPGRIDIELGRARISLTGRVDLDVLHTVLATLRPR